MKSKSSYSYLPISMLGLAVFAACEPPREPRVYNAPKEDTVFVVKPPSTQPPMMRAGAGMAGMTGGAGIAAAEKRILGSIFPIDGAGCFLKITDTIDRIEKIKAPLAKITSEFQLDADGKPSFTLPEGWTIGAGDAIALAKVSIPVPGESNPAIMTVTILNAPDLSDAATADSAWKQYVLEQMNRWNGQVSLDSQNLEDMLSSLTPVQREGTPVLAYVFDKNGSHTKEAAAKAPAVTTPEGSTEPAKEGAAPSTLPAETLPTEALPTEALPTAESADPAKDESEAAKVEAPAPSQGTATEPPSAGPLPSDAKMPDDANHAGLQGSGFNPANLKYETPDGWQIQPPRTFRLATFKIPGVDGDRDGEVVLSLALDNPIENSKMWAEQVLKTDDPAILEPKATSIVEAAEAITAGSHEGKLYRIQGAEDAAATLLEVAVIPMPNMETSMFVKLNSSQRMAEEQKENLRRFVNSLRWE